MTRRTRYFLFQAAALLAAGLQGISAAQTRQDVTGQWALQLGKRTLMLLNLQPSSGQQGPVTGTLSRPQHFQTSDGVSFSHVKGPTETEPIVLSEWKGQKLAITVQNPKDHTDTDEFLFTIKDKTDAEFQLEGVPLPPMQFKRVTNAVSVSEDWSAGRKYSPDDDAVSNPEMKRIFEEDQRVRQPYAKIDWPTVSTSDAERRKETMQLIQQGALHSGDDFIWAAFVFQHGSSPNDYLLAHTLAIIAMSKGDSDAVWIAAATLDRYLQSIKQPQIYGTQFLTPAGEATTQEPYDRSLISDALRHDLTVPDLAAQQAQRQKLDTERKVNGKANQP